MNGPGVSSKERGTTTTLLLICDANGYFKYVVGRGWRCRVKIMNRKCGQWRKEWNTYET